MNIRNFVVALGATLTLAVSPLAAQESALDLAQGPDELHVAGARPGDLIGVCLGYDPVQVMLPGNALLMVHPLQVWVLGSVDSKGEFMMPMTAPPVPSEPIDMLMQAIAVNESGDQFQTSQLRHLRFDGAHYSVHAE